MGGQLLAVIYSIEKLVHVVNEITEQLLDLQPKPEPLWWASTHKDENGTTLKVENRSQTWDWPFMEVFDVLGHRFHRDGERAQGTEKTLRKGVGSWWRDGYICRSRSVPTKTTCRRVSVMFAAPPSIG